VDLLCQDANHDTRGIVQLAGGTGADTGTLVAYVDYDAFGNPITQAGGSAVPGGLTTETGGYSFSTTSTGFGSAYVDSSSLDYLVNRYYDQATGQFISVDPMVRQTGTPFAYAGDDPAAFTDPNGLFTVGICAGVADAAGIFIYHAPFTGTGSVCLVRLQYNPLGKDDIGFSETGGRTVNAVGISSGANVFYQISDAKWLGELKGRFHEISIASPGIGWGGTASYFWGTSQNGKHIHGIDLGVSFGVSASSVTVYSTFTYVQIVRQGWIADPLRWLWDGLVPHNLPGEAGLSNLIQHAEKQAGQ
jgi:RHS repeat-associated protein